MVKPPQSTSRSRETVGGFFDWGSVGFMRLFTSPLRRFPMALLIYPWFAVAIPMRVSREK